MSSNTASLSWRRRLRAFRADRKGNVTTLFTIALIPIMASVGAAVDYSHANSIKAAMQAALDSIGLFLATNAASQTEAQLQATNYFSALFNRPEAKNLQLTAAYSADGSSKVFVKASVQMDTDFIGIMVFKQSPSLRAPRRSGGMGRIQIPSFASRWRLT